MNYFRVISFFLILEIVAMVDGGDDSETDHVFTAHP